MAQERVDQTPRELKFGGEKAESIKRGFAITTLRNPRPSYDFEQGEVILADCFDDGEKVSVIVLSNETKNLADFEVTQLALDGFFSAEQAAKEMQEWPGYENTSTETKMQAITFIDKEAFDKIPVQLQKDILNNDFDYFIGIRALRHLFFPTMCYQFTARGGDVTEWRNFLRENGIISRYDARVMKNFDVRGTNPYEFYTGFPDALQRLSLMPGAPSFKALVSCQVEED